ncbi:hypothetical protein RRG08_057046 [Elysia crispata]|uniref:Uncharacterized protein n=1 Tax=Elysia crispata TaxID=231223 RepID=A0AAE0Z7C2_9GAST|nr:hypothetical protein RRG08_057046 [Elysia crispata]
MSNFASVIRFRLSWFGHCDVGVTYSPASRDLDQIRAPTETIAVRFEHPLATKPKQTGSSDIGGQRVRWTPFLSAAPAPSDSSGLSVYRLSVVQWRCSSPKRLKRLVSL